MKSEIMRTRWEQVRGQVQAWWSRLTEDDLDRIGGHKDRLVEVILERYGFSRSYVSAEVDRRLNSFLNAADR